MIGHAVVELHFSGGVTVWQLVMDALNIHRNSAGLINCHMLSCSVLNFELWPKVTWYCTIFITILSLVKDEVMRLHTPGEVCNLTHAAKHSSLKLHAKFDGNPWNNLQRYSKFLWTRCISHMLSIIASLNCLSKAVFMASQNFSHGKCLTVIIFIFLYRIFFCNFQLDLE